MEAWKSMVALTVAAVVAAGPAWAQSSTTPADKKNDKAATGTMEKSADKSTTGTTDKSATGDKAARGEMKADKAAKGDKMSAKGGQNVRAAQQALKDKGHDPGPIDGKMGPKTQAALKDFQKAQGLKETGRLDNETMAKLEVKTGAADTGTTPAASPKTDASAAPSTSTTTEAPKSGTAAQPCASPSKSPSTTEAPKAEEKKQ